jgi:hypothetical protein
MTSIDALSEEDKKQVYGECLACLAYFAIETNRCSRRDLQQWLADSTRLNETPSRSKRLSWWSSKLGNIQYAFGQAGLLGTVVHGYALSSKRGAGRRGQPGTQRRISQFAVPIFLSDLGRCAEYGQRYLYAGRTESPSICYALFGDINPRAPTETVAVASIPREESLSAEDAEKSPYAEALYLPSDTDERVLVNRQILARRGQETFRNALRSRYQDACVVTGCELLAILEAAHINPHRGRKDNAPSNGLLLRADIHTLFDLDLLAIEPDTLAIRVHPELPADYQSLTGRRMMCKESARPSDLALRERHQRFISRCLRPLNAKTGG